MPGDFLRSVNLILQRDLDVLEKEITLYPDKDSLWKVSGEVKNPAGTLCLHLCGNLQHYIGAVLGNTGYVRNRENEFSARGILRTDLLAEIRNTKKSVESTLLTLDESVLEKEYPQQVFGYPMTTTFFLIHLAAHFNYHLGQVNYLRRLITAS